MAFHINTLLNLDKKQHVIMKIKLLVNDMRESALQTKKYLTKRKGLIIAQPH